MKDCQKGWGILTSDGGSHEMRCRHKEKINSKSDEELSKWIREGDKGRGRVIWNDRKSIRDKGVTTGAEGLSEKMRDTHKARAIEIMYEEQSKEAKGHSQGMRNFHKVFGNGTRNEGLSF
jgi:hypothetical protein